MVWLKNAHTLFPTLIAYNEISSDLPVSYSNLCVWSAGFFGGCQMEMEMEDLATHCEIQVSHVPGVTETYS